MKLPAEPIKVAQHPGAQEQVIPRDEEGGTSILETAMGGRQAKQRACVGSGVAESCGCLLIVADESHNVVAEVCRPRANRISIHPPLVSTNGLLPERAAELELSVQHGIDGGVVPAVPQLFLEGLDHPSDG